MSASDRKVKIYEKRLAMVKAKVRLYQLGRKSAKSFASLGMIDKEFHLKFDEVLPLATDEMMKIIQLCKEGGDIPEVEDLPDFFDCFLDVAIKAMEDYRKNRSLRTEAMESAINAMKLFIAAARNYLKWDTDYLDSEFANV